MAEALGVTMCLLSVCGEASNTRRCICEPTRASAGPAAPLDAILISTIPSVHIRALTAPHPIRPTSQSCRSARQPNPGRGSTYRRGNSVQRFGTTAKPGDYLFPCRGRKSNRPLTPRQFGRLVKLWVVDAGFDPVNYGVDPLRRTKALHILKGTGDLQTVRVLLGHARIEGLA